MNKTFVTLAIIAALSSCSDSDNAPMVMPQDDAIVTGTTGGTQNPGEPDSSSLINQLTTVFYEEGFPASLWDCYDQNNDFVAEFVFTMDGKGQLAQEGDAEEVVDFTWQESTGNSILMSIETQGDSQLQTIVFSDDGNFSTTDRSISGSAPDPLMCEFVDLPENPGA